MHLVTHGHFRSRDKDDSHTIQSAISKNPMPHINFMTLSYRTGVIANRSFTLREYGFATFLLLWPWPWPNNLHMQTWTVPYSLEMCWICKYQLPTSRLSKVIVRQTEKQTDTTEIIYHAASQVVNNNGPEFCTKKYNKFTCNFKHLAIMSSFVNKKAVFILELSTAAYIQDHRSCKCSILHQLKVTYFV